MITYPVPSAEILALGGRAQSIMAYRKETVVELLDGTEVRPTLRTAKAIVTGAAKGLTVPVIVSEGSYQVVDREAEARAAEAEKLKWDRFKMFMAEDGLQSPNPETSTCDTCGEHGPGSMHYSPDAMGYPTPTLFTGDCCSAS